MISILHLQGHKFREMNLDVDFNLTLLKNDKNLRFSFKMHPKSFASPITFNKSNYLLLFNLLK